MEYSAEQASAVIGKRVIVSLRHLNEGGTETFAGLWGRGGIGDGGPIVTDVDHEMYWASAASPERLSPQSRRR